MIAKKSGAMAAPEILLKLKRLFDGRLLNVQSDIVKNE
jgi:hypothetical protein